RPARRIEQLRAPPDAQERLLADVLRAIAVAQQPLEEAQERRRVAVVQRAQRLRVLRRAAADERDVALLAHGTMPGPQWTRGARGGPRHSCAVPAPPH